jgi:hypothetical protein
MSKPLITSRIGDHIIEVPVSLLAQLRHERERHRADIQGRISEANGNALLDQAEYIRIATEQHITQRESSA